MNAMRLSCKRNGEWGGKSQFARLTVGDEIWKSRTGRGEEGRRGERKLEVGELRNFFSKFLPIR